MVDGVRRGAVLQYLTAPRSTIVSAAHKFSMSRNSVAAIIAGVPRTDMRPRGGKKALTPKARAIRTRRQTVTRLIRKTKTERGRRLPASGSLRHVQYALYSVTGVRVSKSTLRRDLKASGFENRVRPKRPFDTKMQARRLSFAKEPRWGVAAILRRLVFSDEHWCTANDNSVRTQWVQSAEDLIPRVRQSRFNIPSVQLWGAIGVDFRSKPVFIEKTEDEDGVTRRMNAESYKRRCLQPHVPMLLRHNALFMQDGARCHTARSVTAYLDSKKVEYIKTWPAHSPDLNPIESFWAYLDRHLTEHYPPPADAAELKDQIRKAWDEIPQAKINAFVLGFGDRVKACLRRKGA